MKQKAENRDHYRPVTRHLFIRINRHYSSLIAIYVRSRSDLGLEPFYFLITMDH